MAYSPFGPLAVRSGVNSPECDGATLANDDNDNFNALLTRYAQFINFDSQKTEFMRELMQRIQRLTLENQSLKENQRKNTFTANWIQEKQRYENSLYTLERAMEGNPFVMVLIDGDGMIFNSDLLREGETGGRRAASVLYAKVQDYLNNELTDIPLGTQILCRVYANVRGLSNVLVQAGAIDDASVFEAFVSGFTRGKALFDFIDVGPGKDRADKKIIESLKLFSQDLHCRRVLFGCSHDNGYARVLEDFSDRPEVVSKVVLVEGVPFEKELLPLPYSTKKFDGLFRNTKIALQGGTFFPSLRPNAPTPATTGNVYNAFTGMPSRFPAPPGTIRPSTLLDSPISGRVTPALNGLQRTPSSSTIASEDPKLEGPKSVFTWAKAAAAPAPPVTEVPRPEPSIRDEAIHRNRLGQRIDPKTRDYDKTEVDRIKKLKLCNVHYLKGECPYITKCTHDHSYNLGRDEVATLRLVARMAPCTHGSGCQDIKCIYGHRCPAPPHRNHVKGTKSCIFGDSCKFPEDLHDIDTNVVKTLVIR